MDQLGHQLARVAAVPAVADDDHDGAVAEHASRPLAVEVAEGVADACAAAEVVHALAHRIERPVEVAVPEQPRDAREAGREDERLQILSAHVMSSKSLCRSSSSAL